MRLCRLAVVEASGNKIAAPSTEVSTARNKTQVRRLRRGGRGEGGRAGSILTAVALEEEARVLLLRLRGAVHAHDAFHVARAERIQQGVVVESR